MSQIPPQKRTRRPAGNSQASSHAQRRYYEKLRDDADAAYEAVVFVIRDLRETESDGTAADQLHTILPHLKQSRDAFAEDLDRLCRAGSGP